MERYEWTIRGKGELASMQSSEVPELVHTYSTVGIYEVTVVAHARDGASGRLTTSTSVCVGAGGSCATGAPCCSGTCASDGSCR